MTEQAPEAPEQTPPAPDSQPDTGSSEVEKWKALARKHEDRAKENASAAQRLQALEDEKKSEQQRLEDRAATAERERDVMKADALRWKVAAKHNVNEADLPLLEGITDEAKLDALAQRLAKPTPEPQGQPTPSRPKENLRPGATPIDHKSEDDLVYEQLFGAK